MNLSINGDISRFKFFSLSPCKKNSSDIPSRIQRLLHNHDPSVRLSWGRSQLAREQLLSHTYEDQTQRGIFKEPLFMELAIPLFEIASRSSDRYIPVCGRPFCLEAFPQETGSHRPATWPNNWASHGPLLFWLTITCLRKASSRDVEAQEPMFLPA